VPVRGALATTSLGEFVSCGHASSLISFGSASLWAAFAVGGGVWIPLPTLKLWEAVRLLAGFCGGEARGHP